MEFTAEIVKLINILDKFFKKADDAQVPLLYTTGDVFARLQSVYPSDTYAPTDVYEILSYKEFEFINSEGTNKIYWLIQETDTDI